MAERKAWERQEGETGKAFAAFCVYRDMGTERSIEKAYRRGNGRETASVPGYFAGWSARHDWVARAEAYDAFLGSVAVASVVGGIEQDREEYRTKVKQEAADFAQAAVAMRREAMMHDNKAEASLMLSRAVTAWREARQVEGIALGLVSE